MRKERELILDLYDHLNHSDVDCRFDVSDIIKKVDEYLSQPEPTKKDLILEWYTKGYKQGLTDGIDISKDRVIPFANSIMEK